MRTSYISAKGALGLAIADAMKAHEGSVSSTDQIGMLVDLITIRLSLMQDTRQRTDAGVYAMNRISQAARGR